MCKKLIVISAVFIVVSCLGEKHDTHSADSPWAWPDNGYPIPTEAQWAVAIARYVEDNNSSGGFVRLDTDDMTTQVDFLKTHGMWFSALISRHNQEQGAYQAGVGWLRGGRLGYRIIGDAFTTLNGLELDNYLKLLETDSLWTYFGRYGFWEVEEWFETAYDTIGRGSGKDDGQWTIFVKISDLNNHLSSRHKNEDNNGNQNKSWLTVSFMLFNNVAQFTTLADSTLADLTPRQETFISHGKYFAGLYSRRNLNKGTYIAVVGQRFTDSVIYRQLNEQQLLSGKELNDYIDLVKQDSIWSLIGPRKYLDDEAGLERLWDLHQAKGEKKVLHFAD